MTIDANAIGMNNQTGAAISGTAHLRQSIKDILTTPLNTRLMMPEYGSDLPRLVDAPSNSSTVIDIYIAVAVALKKWEPRYQLNRVQLTRQFPEQQPGQIEIELDGTYLVNGEPLKLEGLLL